MRDEKFETGHDRSEYDGHERLVRALPVETYGIEHHSGEEYDDGPWT